MFPIHPRALRRNYRVVRILQDVGPIKPEVLSTLESPNPCQGPNPKYLGPLNTSQRPEGLGDSQNPRINPKLSRVHSRPRTSFPYHSVPESSLGLQVRTVPPFLPSTPRVIQGSPNFPGTTSQVS